MGESSRQSGGAIKYKLHKSETGRSTYSDVLDKAKFELRCLYFSKVVGR